MLLRACRILVLVTIVQPPAVAEDIVRLGVGSYTTALPPGGREPQAMIYQTAAVRSKMPTNDWWSSLAWMPLSERQYPHPLAI